MFTYDEMTMYNVRLTDDKGLKEVRTFFIPYVEDGYDEDDGIDCETPAGVMAIVNLIWDTFSNSDMREYVHMDISAAYVDGYSKIQLHHIWSGWKEEALCCIEALDDIYTYRKHGPNAFEMDI